MRVHFFEIAGVREMLDRFAAAIDKLLVVVASATILLMLCITTISVIGRYLFKTPIPDDVVMNELLIVVLRLPA